MRKYWILIIFWICLSSEYTVDKVKVHFQSIDKNNDGLLFKEQYIELLQKEDEENEIYQQRQYYEQLTFLLFEMYDTDKDGAINLVEWDSLGQDIVDQNSPEYQQMKNIKLKNQNTEL